MANDNNYFEFLDIPDGSGGTVRWYAKDAEARAAIEELDPASVENKADKVSGATNNHLAALDSNGNLKDSGKAAGDFATQEDMEAVEAAIGMGTSVEYVDLGLPSGTLWAKTNIGADSEEESGLFFQWADIQGYAGDSGHQFTWDTYKYGTADALTKYNETDGKGILDAEDDIVKLTNGLMWSMPSREQFLELSDRTTHEITTINGQIGMKFISKGDATKYIFVPAAGWMKTDVGNVGIEALLWSRTLSSWVRQASQISIYCAQSGGTPAGGVWVKYEARSTGMNIRGVLTPLSEKADKAPNATAGNLAALDASGNIIDSGSGIASVSDTIAALSELT